ncbi:DUF4232 domain-containing protein [Streptomyces sp. NPDC090106]|uniref:DUF4232 domain-containing protein n=1 Tax=Streptomyces sp. NPDC090106 TaxID=3365946 RepID=UPI003800DABC
MSPGALLPAFAALTATLLPVTAPDPAETAPCPEHALVLHASRVPSSPSVVRVEVTNRGGRACSVAPFPTVTFQDLDGSAQPVPAQPAGRYRLAPGATARATVRTIADPADPEARRTGALAVAADPAHRGRAFTAARLGGGDTIRVWEPVTSRWRPSQDVER